MDQALVVLISELDKIPEEDLDQIHVSLAGPSVWSSGAWDRGSGCSGREVAAQKSLGVSQEA